MATPETHHLTFADWTTRVLRAGAGDEPLVLLHSHGVDADMWLPLIDALPAGVPALALDLRGQGASTNRRRPVTLELLADDVIAVLEHEGVRRCTVVGLALGGTVAQLVATRAPRLTARLVLMDTAATRTPQSRQSLLDRAGLAERGGLGGLIDAAIPRWFPDTTPAPDAAVLAALRAMMERADPHEYAAVGRAFADLELRDNAALIGCPTLVVVGAEDVAMPVAASRLLHELIPGSELVVLPGIGHCPPLHDPALVARLLTGWR
ncbi:MAG TPA: alpha/beta fold hydrolase [Rugosimonospora sp.]|nr:alpha/beta fold hydrolase [Rugosimonospora sp.]